MIDIERDPDQRLPCNSLECRILSPFAYDPLDIQF